MSTLILILIFGSLWYFFPFLMIVLTIITLGLFALGAVIWAGEWMVKAVKWWFA